MSRERERERERERKRERTIVREKERLGDQRKGGRERQDWGPEKLANQRKTKKREEKKRTAKWKEKPVRSGSTVLLICSLAKKECKIWPGLRPGPRSYLLMSMFRGGILKSFAPLIIRTHRFKGPPLFQKQIGPPKFRALTPQIEKAAPGIPLFTKSHTATQTPSRNRRKVTDFNKHRDAQSSPRPMQSH